MLCFGKNLQENAEFANAAWMPPMTQPVKLADYRGLACPTLLRRSIPQATGNPSGKVICLVKPSKVCVVNSKQCMMAIVSWTIAMGQGFSNLYISRFESRSFNGIYSSINTFLLPFPILHFAAGLPSLFHLI